MTVSVDCKHKTCCVCSVSQKDRNWLYWCSSREVCFAEPPDGSLQSKTVALAEDRWATKLAKTCSQCVDAIHLSSWICDWLWPPWGATHLPLVGSSAKPGKREGRTCPSSSLAAVEPSQSRWNPAVWMAGGSWKCCWKPSHGERVNESVLRNSSNSTWTWSGASLCAEHDWFVLWVPLGSEALEALPQHNAPGLEPSAVWTAAKKEDKTHQPTREDRAGGVKGHDCTSRLISRS